MQPLYYIHFVRNLFDFFSNAKPRRPGPCHLSRTLHTVLTSIVHRLICCTIKNGSMVTAYDNNYRVECHYKNKPCHACKFISARLIILGVFSLLLCVVTDRPVIPCTETKCWKSSLSMACEFSAYRSGSLSHCEEEEAIKRACGYLDKHQPTHSITLSCRNAVDLH